MGIKDDEPTEAPCGHCGERVLLESTGRGVAPGPHYHGRCLKVHIAEVAARIRFESGAKPPELPTDEERARRADIVRRLMVGDQVTRAELDEVAPVNPGLTNEFTVTYELIEAVGLTVGEFMRIQDRRGWEVQDLDDVRIVRVMHDGRTGFADTPPLPA